MRILFIRRGRDYSPNSAEKDAEILHKVSMQLGNHGHEVTLADENEASRIIRSYDCVVSMSRDAHTLQLLQDVHNDGTLVINNPQAVMLAGKRKEISKRLSRAGVTTAPAHGNHGYWVKKATGWSMTAKDVMFAQDRSEADSIATEMKANGAEDVEVTAHVVGDLVKFYGVRSTGFLRTYYPGDDRQWKFGDEERNGVPQHYDFGNQIAIMAEKAAEATGLDVYGGDCIVNSSGNVTVIDFNDWPSFSRCADEAAEAIAKRIMTMAGQKKQQKKEYV